MAAQTACYHCTKILPIYKLLIFQDKYYCGSECLIAFLKKEQEKQRKSDPPRYTQSENTHFLDR